MGNDYLVEGDLVRTQGFDEGSDIGIVVEIGKHGQVHVFWPNTGKVTKSGKDWAELNFELVVNENPKEKRYIFKES